MGSICAFHSAFNCDRVGFSPSGPSRRSSALLEHQGGNDIALHFLVIGSSIKEVGHPILYHLLLGVSSHLAPDIINKSLKTSKILLKIHVLSPDHQPFFHKTLSAVLVLSER